MDFNSIFFPAPSQKYTCADHFGEMIYIPKVVPSGGGQAYIAYDTNSLPDAQNSSIIHIPCLYIKFKPLP